MKPTSDLLCLIVSNILGNRATSSLNCVISDCFLATTSCIAQAISLNCKLPSSDDSNLSTHEITARAITYNI